MFKYTKFKITIMNKIIWVWFEIFILISIYVGAAQTYTETIENKGTIDINGHSVNPEYLAGNGQVILRIDGSGELMVPGECVTKNKIKSCVDSADLDNVVVTLEFLGPEITIQKTFSNTNPTINERVNVEVILQNTGADSADGVVYTDAYPNSIIVNPTSQNRVGNSIVWQGRIGKGKQEKFIYSITTQEIGDFEVVGKAEYDSQGQKYESTSKQTIAVTAPFNFDSEISKESPSKDEVIDFKVTIENKGDDYLDVKDLIFEVPSRVDIVSAPKEVKIAGKTATYETRIAKEQSEELVLKVKGTSVGEFTVKASGTFNLKGVSYDASTSQMFGVGVSNIVPIITLEPEKLKSGSMYNVEMQLKNRGKETIEDVDIVVESELFSVTETKDVPASVTIDVFKKELQAKDVKESTSYKIILKGAYSNADGKVLSFNEEKILVVEPQETIAEIIQEVKREGNKFIFEVSVKNLKGSTVEGVSVSDIMPVGLRSSLEGDITIDTTLAAYETKKAYSYSIEVPEDYEENKFEVKTLFNGKLNGELYKQNKIKEVVINEVEESEPKSDDSQGQVIGEEGNTELNTEPKFSFIQKIINFFKNLFSNSEKIDKEENKTDEN